MLRHPIAIALAIVAISTNSLAQVTETALRDLVIGKATFADVVARFGQPTKSEYNDEGLRAVVYVDNSTQLNEVSKAALAGSLASIFIPGSAGLATSVISTTMATVAGGATGTSQMAGLVFDKNDVLIRYQAIFGTSQASTFGATAQAREVTSRDGADPMPNITLNQATLSTPPQAAPSFDRPRLGITYLPIRQLEERAAAAFQRAKFDGVVINGILEHSVAARAGFRANDYLYILNGQLVATADDVVAAMSTIKPGDSIKARVMRVDHNTRLVHDRILSLQF